MTATWADWLILLALAIIADAAFGGRKLLGRISGPDRAFYILSSSLAQKLDRASRSALTLYVRSLLVMLVLVPPLYFVGEWIDQNAFGGSLGTLFSIVLLSLIVGQHQVWQVVREIVKALATSREAKEEDRYGAARWAIERMIIRFSDGLISSGLIFIVGGFSLLLPFRLIAMMVAVGSPTGIGRSDSHYYDLPTLLFEILCLPGTILSWLLLSFALLFVPDSHLKAFKGLFTGNKQAIFARFVPVNVLANGLNLAFEVASHKETQSKVWIGPDGGKARVGGNDIRRALMATIVAFGLAFLTIIIALGVHLIQ